MEREKKPGFFKRLLPTTYINTIMLCIDEISNWSFFKKTIKFLDESGEAKKRKWKINLEDNSINFVVNLQPESLLYNDADVRNYEMMVVSNKILQTDSDLSDYSMFGMVDYTTDRILTDKYYGYGIKGTYKMNKVDKSDIVYVLLYTTIVTALVIVASFLVF